MDTPSAMRTLALSMPEGAFRDVLGPIGVTFSDEACRERYVGFDDIGAIRSMLGDAGRPVVDADVAALVAAKRPFSMLHAKPVLVVFDGAAEIVRDHLDRHRGSHG